MADILIAILSIAKEVVIMVAAGVGAVVAWRGLNTWNRQLKGGVEYDLTRRLLTRTYRLRDALKAVRDPVMFPSERSSPPAESAQKMSADEIRHFGTEAAYQARWDRVNDARKALQDDLIEAEVLWSEHIYKTFEPLFKLQNELLGVLNTYLRSMDPKTPERVRESLDSVLRKKRDIIYDGASDDSDEYNRDMSAAIAKIQLFLKPYLKK